MGRRRKSEDGGTATVEKKRKAVKTERIDREHAGKVVEPYKITERLIAEVDAFAPLKEARVVMCWQRGWRPDADRVLVRAKIRKASDVDKELGKEFDYAIFLNRELWKETKISDEAKEIDIFHELCHAAPEMDRDGSQRRDDRGRLCWRCRKHPIQEFPEVIQRYGLKKVTGLNAAAIAALEDEKKRNEASAEANDAKRPLIQAAEKAAQKNAEPSTAWRKWNLQQLENHGLPAGKRKLLEQAELDTMGKLIDKMNKSGGEDHWWKDVKGFGESGYNALVDAMMSMRKALPEFQAAGN